MCIAFEVDIIYSVLDIEANAKMLTDRQMDIQSDRWTYSQTDEYTDRQMNIQSER